MLRQIAAVTSEFPKFGINKVLFYSISILSVGGASRSFKKTKTKLPRTAANANPILQEAVTSAKRTKANVAHLHRLVKDAVANLDHLQVLFLFVPGALDVGHPAALVLLAGIDEAAHRPVLVEHLGRVRDKCSGLSRRGPQTKTRETSLVI